MEHDSTGDHVTADFQACIEDGTVSQNIGAYDNAH